MKALVTGGAGFIGSHIAHKLLREGYHVVVIDNLSSGREENLAGLGAEVELVEGDIRDAALVTRAAAGCRLVFHQAAVVSVPYSVQHPRETHAVNIAGTLNVLLAARDAGTERLVFASSAAVYGEDPALPKRESMTPAPVSPYAVEKLCVEHDLAVFNQLYGLPCVSLRYFNVFGPRQDPGSPYSGVTSIFVDRLRHDRDPIIYGDGEQFRDFVAVDNVVQANWLAATHADAPGKVFNVGCGQRTSLNTLLVTLGRITGHESNPTYEAPRAGDIRESVADISLIRQTLGYEPTVGLQQGLEALVAYETGSGGGNKK